MTSRATPDDQLKFLLNCVKHSNNGKIDFVEVARECGIVSKGAAAKRYERLMKANGIHPNGGPSPVPSSSPVPPSRPSSKTSAVKGATAKRRKLGDSCSARMRHDDGTVGKLEKPKQESLDVPELKSELSAISTVTMPVSTPIYALSDNPPAGFDRAPESQIESATSVFEEFCIPEMFCQHSFEEALMEDCPRYLPVCDFPPTLPATTATSVQDKELDTRRHEQKLQGRDPTESIIIAD